MVVPSVEIAQGERAGLAGEAADRQKALRQTVILAGHVPSSVTH
jgi:hypothetical protein